MNTFPFHSLLKVTRYILYWSNSAPWYLTVTLQANSLLPALLPWQSIHHVMPHIEGPPRTRFQECLGRCLPSPARKSPSAVAKPGHGDIVWNLPREKSNVLQFLVVTRNNTFFSLCSVISVQLRLLNAFMDPGQNIFSNRYWNKLFHVPVL